MPAIYDLANRGLLSPDFALVGFARREWADQDFSREVHDSVMKYARTPFREDTWRQLAAGIRFVDGDLTEPASYTRLTKIVKELDTSVGTDGNHAFYLSIPPGLFPQVLENLQNSGLANSGDPGSWRRVIIEKPFGHDLESAIALNQLVDRVFPADSVFRIDHYLGKETVQNVLAVRFANAMFEPLWNNNFVDNIQITMAEDIGIAGRAGYYDGIGAARDVIQNHLLQLLALTAMEEPLSFEADDIRYEKEKVLRAVSVPEDISAHTSRGQYVAGWQGGVPVIGFLEEDGIPPDSQTETFAAIRLNVQNRRWAGVPFYLRTGKRLGRRVTEIAVIFKHAPHLPFTQAATEELGNNALVFRIQPDEGITVRFGSKVPDTSPIQVRDVTMDFQYGDSFVDTSPEAYERLILDVLLGDPPLFPRREEVELSWKILDPVLRHWVNVGHPENYAAGGWGPSSAYEMISKDGRTWRRP
jgi:glucose-6-phosphate 1-dehydrogenase